MAKEYTLKDFIDIVNHIKDVCPDKITDVSELVNMFHNISISIIKTFYTAERNNGSLSGKFTPGYKQIISTAYNPFYARYFRAAIKSFNALIQVECFNHDNVHVLMSDKNYTYDDVYKILREPFIETAVDKLYGGTLCNQI